jgi:hypothetical protein
LNWIAVSLLNKLLPCVSELNSLNAGEEVFLKIVLQEVLHVHVSNQ